jgi:hypothetical protein
MSKETECSLNLTMSSDKKYVTYLKTAIHSIRQHNSNIPIDVYSCSQIDNSTSEKNVQIHKVPIPSSLKNSLSPDELDHASTRIAKLESMNQKGSEQLMYIDSDIIALEDIGKISKDLSTADSNNPVVYMLLRRPHTLSIKEIGWLYFKNVTKLSPHQMANLVNNTFSADYSADRLQNIRCWNGGIIYGSTEGVNTLANLWRSNYLKMLTENNKDFFVPNDQLCLWLAVDQLESSLTIRELPLAWNFMPGHALEEIIKQADPKPEDIKQHLTDIKILHFAQNKTDRWAQVLIDEVNSKAI